MGNNGNNFIKTILMYVVGVLVTLILFIGFPTLVNSVIANDCKRQDEDKAIRQEISNDRKEIAAALAKITNQLASIDTELRLSRKEATYRDDRNEERR